jgi:EAL domain-containing protein (putative c-di-GMP-specific phosphodiesterase class I)
MKRTERKTPTPVETQTPAESTVLIVDDEAWQRRLVQEVIQQLDLTYVQAENLAQARAHLSHQAFAFIVLDLSLGQEDGIELLRDLARLKSPSALIFISGFDDRICAAAGRLATAYGLRIAGTLQKPLQLMALKELLQSWPAQVTPTSPRGDLLLSADDLAQGLAQGEIIPVFQPKIDLLSGRTVGVEALARWDSPRFGEISPEQFVPLAEDAGLIEQLTRVILIASLRQCAQWRKIHPQVGLAVNLSPSIFDLALPEAVEQLLHEIGVPADVLTLEVTESVIVADAILAADVLTRLRIKGVQLAIDDFGTGYASLGMLLRLPFNELKIDRMFVERCHEDADSLRIVKAVISLAHEMGLRVVAEGVESSEIREALARRGCDYGQGWLWPRALTAPALIAWLDAGN